MKPFVGILIAFVLAGVGAFVFSQLDPNRNARETVQEESTTTTYVAQNNDRVVVTGTSQEVTVTTPLLQGVVLTRIPDDSGMRYRSEDKRIVFWRGGTDMFIEVDGEVMYVGVLEEAEVVTESDDPSIVWTLEERGETDFGAPLSEVSVSVNDVSFTLGEVPGTCSEDSLPLLENQVSSYLCWWAGFGTEFAVFAEGNDLLVKKGSVDEGTEGIEAFRGDFETLHTVAL